MVLENAMRVAATLGVSVKWIFHKVTIFKNVFCYEYFSKSDRPTSQYWNTGMVAGHRDLAKKYNIPITHVTEQASHNKVISFNLIAC